MTPEDPRHGTTRGFHAGCRDICCRRAIARYEKALKVRRMQGITWAIPALGTQRRIQSLMAIGWTSHDIAMAAGWTHRNQVFRILKGQNGKPCRWVERKTYRTVAEVYERLSMKLPDHTPARARCRSIARRKGWVPPLAWDDIDTDPAPTGVRESDELTRRRVTRADIDQHACPRCGVMRQARTSDALCIDCRVVEEVAS